MGVKNNERFARAGKANVNGKRPLSKQRFWQHRRQIAEGDWIKMCLCPFVVIFNTRDKI
jgi:hypothetical protein